MKKIFQLLSVCMLMLVAVSCGQGATAVNNAYDEALKASSPEKVATTLCNGHINVTSLSEDEYAKLGACLGYITFTGMYSSNFEAQVDMHQFGDLLDAYRDREKTQTDEGRKLTEEYTRNILVANPVPQP